MTIETLLNRIAGKEKNIAKLEAKMGRILKAKETNWQVNPHYYDERDLRWTSRDLEEAKKDLEVLKANLLKEQEKANSRNVPAITEFLNEWEAKMVRYFMNEFEAYKEAKEEYNSRDREYCNWLNSHRFHAEGLMEERKRRRAEWKEYQKEFQAEWRHVMQFLHGDKGFEETMKRDISIEKDRKYDDIIERTNEITGKITDASKLKVGAKGDLNGFITGEHGTAKVTTIGAGGYNIQCFHFRTLIHRV